MLEFITGSYEIDGDMTMEDMTDCAEADTDIVEHCFELGDLDCLHDPLEECEEAEGLGDIYHEAYEDCHVGLGFGHGEHTVEGLHVADHLHDGLHSYDGVH
jgi:hypothetical protein